MPVQGGLPRAYFNSSPPPAPGPMELLLLAGERPRYQLNDFRLCLPAVKQQEKTKNEMLGASCDHRGLGCSVQLAPPRPVGQPRCAGVALVAWLAATWA